jgi:hypothetical protein
MQGILSFLMSLPWLVVKTNGSKLLQNLFNGSVIYFNIVKRSILFGSGSVEKKLGIRNVKPCWRHLV